MELEFDKEIDSILRKTGEAKRGVLVGDKPGEKPKVHLDADQLSAFAENAMPEKTRALYMSHLADCDRCRRILSGLIMLNAEAGLVEERVVAPAISPGAIEPWYRKFLIPNLAYVMGGLVLVFGGLIAITVFRSSQMENAATVSQSVDSPAARGPMFDDAQAVTDQMGNANAASTVANTAVSAKSTNSAANGSANAAAASNTMAAGADSDDRLRKEAAPKDAPGYTLDGVDAAKSTAGAKPVAEPAPPAPAMAAPKREDDA
ncbi:MAG: zf-HC2 domain-containing protein, partial [Pyrinomonadaceae bacterium]